MSTSICIRNSYWLLLVLLVSACGWDDDLNDCVRGNDDIETRVLDLPPFTGVDLTIAGDVFIRQGNEQLVEVEGPDNIIDLLELDVQGNTWDIEFDECVNIDGRFRVFITLPEIEYLAISGSGQIKSLDTLDVVDLILRISGSGDMDLGIEAVKIDSRISGSGEVFMEGDAEDIELRISGSGDYNAFNLSAVEAEVRITGSGDAEVNVSDHLDVEITGSGDVFYRGNPTLDVDISGSGSVVDAN